MNGNSFRKKLWGMGMVIPLLAFFTGCSTFMKADMLLARKDYKGAIELYNKYLERHPDDPNALNNLGFTYFKAGLLDNATQAFQSALDIAPAEPFTTLYLGATYLRQKKLLPAIGIWEQFEDNDRPEVEEEIRKQLDGLRSVSSITGSNGGEESAVGRQMEQAAEKVEAAWYDAEIKALTEGGGSRNGDGGDSMGGSGGGGGGG